MLFPVHICQPTLRANLMLRSAQVVAAFDAEAAFAADHSARSERAKREHPKYGSVEDCVGGEAEPDGAKRENLRYNFHSTPERRKWQFNCAFFRKIVASTVQFLVDRYWLGPQRRQRPSSRLSVPEFHTAVLIQFWIEADPCRDEVIRQWPF